jgi:2-polyprenyl-3-methyl-5-hydroxy-6-metoxy-1,4-benzoquinol methylase
MKNVFFKQSCCVCGSDDANMVIENVVHTNEYDVMGALKISSIDEPKSNIYKCNKCGHYYLNPIVSEEMISTYYSKINSKYYEINDIPIDNRQSESKKLINRIKSVLPTGRVLEIGCGYGNLLKNFSENGYEVNGIEPSPFASSYAIEKLNLNVINGFLNDTTYEENTFDIIVSFDVFEHLSSTIEMMKIIKKILKKEGLLIIGTGNIDSWYARFMGRNWWYFSSWEHISFFTPESSNYLIHSNGFKKKCIEKVSHSGSKLNNGLIFFKTLIKLIINPILKKKYSYNLCFDHLIIWCTNEK